MSSGEDNSRGGSEQSTSSGTKESFDRQRRKSNVEAEVSFVEIGLCLIGKSKGEATPEELSFVCKQFLSCNDSRKYLIVDRSE